MIPYSDSLFRLNDARVKDREKAFIFDVIYRGAASSRKEILQLYKLRPTVLTEALRELKADRLVLESRSDATRSGRPEIILEPNHDRLVSVALYVESRELKAGLLNLRGDILHEGKMEVPRQASGRSFLTCCRGLIDAMLSARPAGADLAGIGFSPSGSIDAQAKRLVATYRWPGIRTLDLSVLERRYGCPLHVSKDLNSLLGYYLTAELAGRQGNTLLFHWGFGVGFAYAQNGVNVNAGHSRFGEIGHTRLDLLCERPCICGARGCLETETAIWALLPALRRLDPRLHDDEQELADFCTARSALVQLPAMRRALTLISVSLVNLYRLFYPARVLLLGPFFANDAIFEELTATVNRTAKRTGDRPVKFHIIPDGYRGCLFANSRQIFSDSLRGLLRARF